MNYMFLINQTVEAINFGRCPIKLNYVDRRGTRPRSADKTSFAQRRRLKGQTPRHFPRTNHNNITYWHNNGAGNKRQPIQFKNYYNNKKPLHAKLLTVK